MTLSAPSRANRLPLAVGGKERRMQSFRCCLVATAISTALVTCPRALASPEFSDGTFNEADWNLVTTWFGDPGTAGAAQATAGGNPGAYRKITNVPGSGPSNLRVV